jgi:nucleotide-binding universal stress UspA family protein
MENLLTSIASFQKLHVAAYVKEQFELEGIECFLTDEGFDTSADHVPKGFKLKVGHKDTELAVSILLRIHKQEDLEQISKDSSLNDKRKILVPIDISNYSVNQLEYAFGIAVKTDAEVKILYVYKDPSIGGPVKHTTSWEKHERIEAAEAYNKAQKELVKFRNELKLKVDKEKRRKTKLHFHLLRGRPENVIISICKRYKPDLVIMSPKEKKGAFIGSVTTNVIEHGNIPVMTIPKSARYKGLDLINIMYATDFYESDNTSLDRLLQIVAPFDTKIHCIHIDIEHDDLIQAKVDELNQLLEKDYSQYNIQCKLFESSDVIKGFEDFIKKNNIDLISFSSPRRTLFYKILHPNRLKKMVSTTKIPMLVFPIE